MGRLPRRLLGHLALAAISACSANQPAPRARPAAPKSEASIAVWSVPWSGTLHNDPALSRDGRLAVVWVYTRGERRPFLFRMQEPVGPLRELTDLVPGFPIDATWAPDSRHVLLLCERTRYASELELALLDLAQSRVTARWPIADAGRAEGPLGFVAGTELVFAVRDATLRSYSPSSGKEAGPRVPLDRTDVAASPLAALVAVAARGDDGETVRVLELPSTRSVVEIPLERPRAFAWSSSSVALAALGAKELVLYRPDQPILRIPFGGPPVKDTVVWGEGARSLALADAYAKPCPTCFVPNPGVLRVFSAETGQALAASTFVSESPVWLLSGEKTRLVADHPVEPRRRPLPGLPFQPTISLRHWLGDERLVFGWPEQVDLDLVTGRVLRTGRDLVAESGVPGELLTCENGRTVRLRESDGTRLGALPLIACPTRVSRFGPYFAARHEDRHVIAAVSSGTIAAAFEGNFYGVMTAERSATFFAGPDGKERCVRLDFATGKPVFAPSQPKEGYGFDTCRSIGDALVLSAQEGNTPIEQVRIWHVSSERYLSGRGTDQKTLTDFCRGLLTANEHGLACVENGAQRSAVLTYDGRFVRQELPTHPVAYALSPDGRTFAAVDAHATLHLFTLGERRATRLKLWTATPPQSSLDAPRKVRRLAFSPDGRALALETYREDQGSDPAYLVLLGDRASVRELPPRRVHAFEFSPSGKKLVVVADRTYVYDRGDDSFRDWGPAASPYTTKFAADERVLTLSLPDQAGNTNTEIVRDAVKIAQGKNLGLGDRHALLGTAAGDVELWTRSGERLGLLPREVKHLPDLSYSGKLGLIGTEPALLVRTGSFRTLALSVIAVGDRLHGLLQAPDGSFAGDDAAVETLRFATGPNLLDARPLTGLDAKSRFYRPSLFEEFRAGRSPESAAQNGAPP